MRRPASLALSLAFLSAAFLCGPSRAAETAGTAGTGKDGERKVGAFVNLMVNTTMIVSALMTEAMAAAMGEMAAGMGESIASALDNTGGAEAGGKEMRRETSQKISEGVREMVAEMLPEARDELGGAVSGLTVDQRRQLLEDIGDPSYDNVFAAVARHDFGLPRLTERLSGKEILAYLDLARKEDPRLGEIMGAVMKLKPPRFVEEMKRAAGPSDGRKEGAPPEKKAEDVPPAIGTLPATHLFPPGAETTISFPSGTERMLSWKSTAGPGASWENSGVEVRQGGATAKTPSGGMGVRPEEGRITVRMKNLEAFPVTVEISLEEPKP